MTYDETMAILDQNQEMCDEFILLLDEPNDAACLYIQAKTGCDKEIAQRIVDETQKDFIELRTSLKLTHSKSAPSKPTIECPYCHSTNTKKISGTSRWLSTGLFGLSSGKIGKQWHCNQCKSDF